MSPGERHGNFRRCERRCNRCGLLHRERKKRKMKKLIVWTGVAVAALVGAGIAADKLLCLNAKSDPRFK